MKKITESKFLTTLCVQNSDRDEGIWILNKPLIYQSVLLQRTIYVPIGFQTDLASVPRIPLVWEAFGNRCHYEAVIHDFMYRIDAGFTFMEANRVFYEAMTVRGKPLHIRTPMFLGVCIGGYPSYHKRMIAESLS